MRAIDADALKEVICTNVYPLTDFFNSTDYGMFWTGGIEKAIDDAPTIDPVKHGKWEKNEGRYGWHCSACGEDDLYAFAWNGNKGGNELQDHYCPNCGTKMDKEEK